MKKSFILKKKEILYILNIRLFEKKLKKDIKKAIRRWLKFLLQEKL